MSCWSNQLNDVVWRKTWLNICKQSFQSVIDILEATHFISGLKSLRTRLVVVVFSPDKAFPHHSVIRVFLRQNAGSMTQNIFLQEKYGSLARGFVTFSKLYLVLKQVGIWIGNYNVTNKTTKSEREREKKKMLLV